jgi:hypothetical protein
MSIRTNYIDMSGNDLGSIFMPLNGNQNIGFNTNYKDMSGNDFRYLFMPLGSYSSIPYNTGYSCNVSGTITDLKNVFAALPIFTATGIYTSSVDTSGNYVIIFTGNGTIKFNFDININVIAVGGGGGGGGGQNKNYGSVGISGGGGGGGSGIGILNDFMIQINYLYEITIGIGGIGGPGNLDGQNGGNTILNDLSNTNYLTATGGRGGGGYYTGSASGIGGTASSNYTITTYTSANGGHGYDSVTSAQNGSAISPLMPITLPNEEQLYFSGGGGGGIYINSVDYAYFGGNAGLNGLGGIAGGNNVNSGDGQNASSYGSGGGGGGCPLIVTTQTYGGTGANGILYIYFQYP